MRKRGGCCGGCCGAGVGGGGAWGAPVACARRTAPRAHTRANCNTAHLANRGLAGESVLPDARSPHPGTAVAVYAAFRTVPTSGNWYVLWYRVRTYLGCPLSAQARAALRPAEVDIVVLASYMRKLG